MKELLLEVFSGFKFLQEICVQSWGSLGFQPDFHLEAVRTLPSERCYRSLHTSGTTNTPRIYGKVVCLLFIRHTMDPLL